ncbi:YraN family protein [Anaerolineales bacterium]
MSSMKKSGDLGEDMACELLNSKGYTIIDRNWHCRSGEIDIIAKIQNIWVFVEVKTRNTRHTSDAFNAITNKKRERLIKSAYQYIHELNLNEETQWRIDVIAIALRQTPFQIVHVEDALDW